MHRVGRWFERSKSSLNASTQSLGSLEESHNLEAAMRAVELIMDDDMEGAEKRLAEGNSAFHKLAKGTLAFMKAALGFEQEFMKEASDMLYEAESSASTSYSKSLYDSQSFKSAIYDRGTEFVMCQAEAQIMTAVVGVLNESLTESLKGFYKLRKAYMTLDSIVQMEATFNKKRAAGHIMASGNQSTESLRLPNPNKSGQITPNGAESGRQHLMQPAQPSALRHTEHAQVDADDSDDEFHDVDENVTATGARNGNQGTNSEIDTRTELDKKIEQMNLSHNSNELRPVGMLRRSTTISAGLLTEGPDSDVFSNPLDIFIHSGVNLMSGLLNLLISVIPPAFTKLLYIVGFRGDRERGIRMLWQASKFSNINGGMASLILFGWYNGVIGFCDIVSGNDPSKLDDISGYPAHRLGALLLEMRRRYPNSHLWIVEEARTEASKRNLDKALAILANPGKSQLKQIEALHMFEKSLCAMHSHKYQLCADSILACVDLNAWSRALYYYIAASAHLCFYRYDKSLSTEDRQKHAKLADELFKTAPTKVGKKKMMGRQLPFDLFVVRKVSKWEERASRLGCSFVDAVGVSPLDEMIFLWNGFKKMNEAQMQKSLGNLAWSQTTPHWNQEDVDEIAIYDLLKAVIHRNMRQYEDSKSVLNQRLLHQTAQEFRGGLKDDWMVPLAHHEMAVNLWMQRTGYTREYGSKVVRDPTEQQPPLDLQHDAKLTREAKGWLEKAKGWEKYQLEARLGMKITAGLGVINRWEEKNADALH